jgi:hypothetical protein
VVRERLAKCLIQKKSVTATGCKGNGAETRGSVTSLFYVITPLQVAMAFLSDNYLPACSITCGQFFPEIWKKFQLAGKKGAGFQGGQFAPGKPHSLLTY